MFSGIFHWWMRFHMFRKFNKLTRETLKLLFTFIIMSNRIRYPEHLKPKCFNSNCDGKTNSKGPEWECSYCHCRWQKTEIEIKLLEEYAEAYKKRKEEQKNTTNNSKKKKN